MARSFRPITSADQEELECLRQVYMGPAVCGSVLSAQAELVSICQAAGDMLSVPPAWILGLAGPFGLLSQEKE